MITPMDSHREIIDIDGQRFLRQFSENSPQYYKKNNKLYNINIAKSVYSECSLGKSIIKKENSVTVGTLNKCESYKMLGFRPADNQDIQFEITLNEIIIDGTIENLNLFDNKEIISREIVKLSNTIYLQSGLDFSKLILRIDNICKHIEIKYTITTSGLSNTDFKFTRLDNGESFLTLSNPIFMDRNLRTIHDFEEDQYTASHELTIIDDSTYIYTKIFDIPQSIKRKDYPIYLDSYIQYGESVEDGYIVISKGKNATWDDTRNSIDAFKQWKGRGKNIDVGIDVYKQGNTTYMYIYRGVISFNTVDLGIISRSTIVFHPYELSTNTATSIFEISPCTFLPTDTTASILNELGTSFFSFSDPILNTYISTGSLPTNILDHFNNGYRRLVIREGIHDYYGNVPVIPTQILLSFYSDESNTGRPYLNIYDLPFLKPKTYFYF